jgi:hypothetical protein
MTTQHDNAKRWRPTFSIRTLVVMVTLVCAYFGCWAATKKWGVDYLRRKGFHNAGVPTSDAPMPFVIWEDWYEGGNKVTRSYHVWFFGYVAKLPWGRDLRGSNK